MRDEPAAGAAGRSPYTLRSTPGATGGPLSVTCSRTWTLGRGTVVMPVRPASPPQPENVIRCSSMAPMATTMARCSEATWSGPCSGVGAGAEGRAGARASSASNAVAATASEVRLLPPAAGSARCRQTAPTSRSPRSCIRPRITRAMRAEMLPPPGRAAHRGANIATSYAKGATACASDCSCLVFETNRLVRRAGASSATERWACPVGPVECPAQPCLSRRPPPRSPLLTRGWTGPTVDGTFPLYAERPHWNHNIAYHHLVLRAAPRPCRRALDVGCGQGFLLSELADHCDEVVGIDPDAVALAAAARNVADRTNVALVRGDVMTADLPKGGFDLVAAVASLHHLPLEPGLGRLAALVWPGGSLVIVGLYRASTAMDYLTSAVAFPVSRFLRWRRGHTLVGAPTQEPTSTLHGIRAAATEVVPGAHIRRRLLFRYVLNWTRPDDEADGGDRARGGRELPGRRPRRPHHRGSAGRDRASAPVAGGVGLTRS